MPINNYGANNPYAYNPMINQQNRLMQMEQQQYNNMYPQNNYFPQNNNNYLKGRLVTCLDEAKASMIDLDGSIFVFPDYANGKIYTKQIGMDGSPIFTVYEKSVQGSNLDSQQRNYEDSINTLSEKVRLLESKIELLESVLEGEVK